MSFYTHLTKNPTERKILATLAKLWNKACKESDRLAEKAKQSKSLSDIDIWAEHTSYCRGLNRALNETCSVFYKLDGKILLNAVKHRDKKI